MCFSVSSPQKAKVAEKDIVCWKALDETIDGKLSSPFRHTIYRFNEIKKAPLLKEAHGSIYSGLHSYIKKSIAVDYFSRRSVFKAIIPKGSLYYANSEHYVSNKLVVLGPQPKKKVVTAKLIKKVTVKKKK